MRCLIVVLQAVSYGGPNLKHLHVDLEGFTLRQVGTFKRQLPSIGQMRLESLRACSASFESIYNHINKDSLCNLHTPDTFHLARRAPVRSLQRLQILQPLKGAFIPRHIPDVFPHLQVLTMDAPWVHGHIGMPVPHDIKPGTQQVSTFSLARIVTPVRYPTPMSESYRY